MVKNTLLSSRSKCYNNGTPYPSIYISHNGSQLIIVWWLKKNISPKYVCFVRARIISVWQPETTVVRARGRRPGHLLNGRIAQIAKVLSPPVRKQNPNIPEHLFTDTAGHEHHVLHTELAWLSMWATEVWVFIQELLNFIFISIKNESTDILGHRDNGLLNPNCCRKSVSMFAFILGIQ